MYFIVTFLLAKKNHSLLFLLLNTGLGKTAANSGETRICHGEVALYELHNDYLDVRKTLAPSSLTLRNAAMFLTSVRRTDVKQLSQ